MLLNPRPTLKVRERATKIMNRISLARRFYRVPERGKVGRALFVSGAGLLSFSAVCLARVSGPYLEIQSTTLVLFAVAAVMILAGETIRLASRSRERLSAGNLLESVGLRRLAPRIERILRDSRCAFCGKTSGTEGSQHKGLRTGSGGPYGTFGRCLNCGSTVCPRCAYLRGKEMGRDALRCPGCGGPVY